MPTFRERYRYDAFGRLIGVEGPAGGVRYTWDGRGHRVAIEPVTTCPACGAPTGDAAVCPACGAATDPFRCKVICPRCRLVVESCSDGGEVPARATSAPPPPA